MTRGQLKNLSKDRLRGKLITAIGVNLLAGMFVFFSQQIANIVPQNSLAGFLTFRLFLFAIQIAVGVVQVGLCLFYLSIACGQPTSLQQLFYGYREQTNKVLFFSFLFATLETVCFTPFELAFQIAYTKGIFNFSVILLLVAGAICYTPLYLMISQSFYIVLDFPQLSTRDTLRYGMKIMKGNKKRAFLLELSFLPLQLLQLLSFGIGFLWLAPYMSMVRANFYLDLIRHAESTSDKH